MTHIIIYYNSLIYKKINTKINKNKNIPFFRMKQARYEEYKATLEAQRRDLYNKQEINKRSILKNRFKKINVQSTHMLP